MKSLITETVIRTYLKRGISIQEIDSFSDVLDLIDFASIIKQKLAEKGFPDAIVEVES